MSCNMCKNYKTCPLWKSVEKTIVHHHDTGEFYFEHLLLLLSDVEDAIGKHCSKFEKAVLEVEY